MTVAADAPPAAPPPRRRRLRREAALAYLLVLPALAVLAVFVYFPFAKNFQLALYRTPAGLPRRYAGFRQITDVLGSSAFRSSLGRTVLFAVLTVPASVLGGLVLAVLARQRLRGIAIYRTVFSSTVLSSVAVASLIFGTLMNPQVGLLPWLGLSPSPPFLDNPTWALPAVALATVWQYLGLSFLLMSAGLQALPEDLLEAAEVDGATAGTRFWRVTVPLLSPTILFAVVVASIGALETFGQVDLLTRGGPQGKTNLLTYFTVTQLQHKNPGQAAVLSIVLFLVTLVLTALQLRFLERRVHYAR